MVPYILQVDPRLIHKIILGILDIFILFAAPQVQATSEVPKFFHSDKKKLWNVATLGVRAPPYEVGAPWIRHCIGNTGRM